MVEFRLYLVALGWYFGGGGGVSCIPEYTGMIFSNWGVSFSFWASAVQNEKMKFYTRKDDPRTGVVLSEERVIWPACTAI